MDVIEQLQHTNMKTPSLFSLIHFYSTFFKYLYVFWLHVHFYFTSPTNLCKAASLLLNPCNVQANVSWRNESSLQDTALKERL